MAQQLDFSPLDNRAEIYRDKAMRQQITQNLIDKTAKGIFDVVDWQRDMRQQFAEASEFDSDITMDAQANSYLANRYEESLRKPAIEAIMNKKFKNQSHINKMLANQQQLGREAANVKGLVKLRTDAEQKAESNPMLFEFDKEAAADFNNFLMGNSDAKNANAYMMRFSGQDGAPPFLKVRVHNPDKYIPSAALSLRDEYSVIKEEAKKKIVGDNMVTTTKQQKVIDDVAKEAFGSMVFSKMMQDTKYKQLWGGFGKYLENKNNTEGNGSAGPIADIENYITNYNYSDILEPRTTKESIKTEPVKETDSTGSGKTDIIELDPVSGGKFRDRPLYFNIDIDGEEGKLGVTEITTNDKDEWVVKGFAPDTDTFKKLYADAVDAKGAELDADEEEAIFVKSMQAGKKKSIEKPLAEFYETGEFNRAAKKAKLQFKGLDKLDLSLKQEEVIEETPEEKIEKEINLRVKDEKATSNRAKRRIREEVEAKYKESVVKDEAEDVDWSTYLRK